MEKLINKYYPEFSKQRKELRKIWNKCQNNDWHGFLENSALGEHWLESFKVLASKCKSAKEFYTEGLKIKNVPSEVSEHFRRKYSHSPFEDSITVASHFYDLHK